MTKRLWALCAHKRTTHKEMFCKEEGGEECECQCHTYLGCSECEKEGHATKNALKNGNIKNNQTNPSITENSLAHELGHYFFRNKDEDFATRYALMMTSWVNSLR